MLCSQVTRVVVAFMAIPTHAALYVLAQSPCKFKFSNKLSRTLSNCKQVFLPDGL